VEKIGATKSGASAVASRVFRSANLDFALQADARQVNLD